MADTPFVPDPTPPDLIERFRNAPSGPTSAPLPLSEDTRTGIDAAVMIEDSLDFIANTLNAGEVEYAKILASAIGAPFDIVNSAMSLVGLDKTNPMFGKQHIEDILNTVGVQTTWENATRVQRIAMEISTGIGTGLGTAGVLGSAAALYKAGGVVGKSLLQPFSDMPGVATAVEGIAGAGAGLGDAIAKEMGWQDSLARFGLAGLGALVFGGPAAFVGMRAGRPTPSGGVGREAIDILPEEVFGPRMAAEVRQADLQSQILDAIKPGMDDSMIRGARELYRGRLDDIDPDMKIWDTATRNAMADAMEERARAGASGAPRRPGATGQDFATYLKASREAAEEQSRVSVGKVMTDMQRGIFDRAAGVRRGVINQAGYEGQRAMMYYDLAAGASSWSNEIMKGARRQVYGGLSKGDRPNLDDLIVTERIARIATYDPGRRVKVKLSDGRQVELSIDDAKAYRDSIRTKVGDAKFADYLSRSDAYFELMKTPLKDMLDAGLIDATQYGALSRFEYMPLRYLNEIDPKLEIMVGSRRISVPSSGVRELGETQRGLIETDTDALMTQVMARAYGRIARNRANQQMLKAAESSPMGDVVRATKPEDKNWSQFSVMVEGKPKKFWMHNDFVEDWVSLGPHNAGFAAEMLKAPANAVRIMATGAGAPEFAVSNLPRDWAYAMLFANETFGNIYSSFQPLAIAQLGRDLATVLPDTVRMRGRATDYLREGGGFSFMAHGAKGEVTPGLSGTWETAARILAWHNEKAELWTRLAIRERGLRNGMTPEEATWSARATLDYSQGGSLVKMLDQYIPYLNASTQGVRGAVRAAHQSPGRTAFKLMQWMGAAGGLAWYNKMHHTEAYRDVDEEVRANNFIIMLPGEYKDVQGNKRHNYIKIPVTHELIAFKAMADALVDYTVPDAATGERTIPKRELVQGFKNSLAAFGDPNQAMNYPLFRFMLALGDYDLWRNEPVWRGEDNLPPHMEYREFPNEPTPQIARDFADLLHSRVGIEVSPERMTAAAHSILPRNLYTTAMTSAYNKLASGEWQPEGEDTRMLPDELIQSRMPFARKVIGTTHPLANIMNKTNEEVAKMRGEDVAVNREADARIARIYGSKSGSERDRNESSYKDWVRGDSVQVQDKQRLINRWLLQTQVKKAFERAPPGPGIPQMAWWINVSGLPADQRASLFHNQMGKTTPDNRARLRELVARMPGFATGGADGFWANLQRMERERPY